MSDLHVHLPENFAGTIHIHQVDDVVTLTRDDSHSLTATTTSGDGDGDGSGSSEVTADSYSPEIEAVLRRQKRYWGPSRSREVIGLLVAEGWEAKAPITRDGSGSSPATYVRLVYRGTVRKAVLYVNSANLVSNGAADREFVSALAGADVRNSDVYFTHSPTDQQRDEALAAARALRGRADGESSPKSTTERPADSG